MKISYHDLNPAQQAFIDETIAEASPIRIKSPPSRDLRRARDHLANKVFADGGILDEVFPLDTIS